MSIENYYLVPGTDLFAELSESKDYNGTKFRKLVSLNKVSLTGKVSKVWECVQPK